MSGNKLIISKKTRVAIRKLNFVLSWPSTDLFFLFDYFEVSED